MNNTNNIINKQERIYQSIERLAQKAAELDRITGGERSRIFQPPAEGRRKATAPPTVPEYRLRQLAHEAEIVNDWMEGKKKRRFPMSVYRQLNGTDFKIIEELAYLSKIHAKNNNKYSKKKVGPLYCYPSRRYLEKKIGVSACTISRHITKLIRLGVIEVIHRRRGGKFATNLYRIVAWVAWKIRSLWEWIRHRVPKQMVNVTIEYDGTIIRGNRSNPHPPPFKAPPEYARAYRVAYLQHKPSFLREKEEDNKSFIAKTSLKEEAKRILATWIDRGTT